MVFEGPITGTAMTTSAVNTGGVAPGVMCYMSTNQTSWLVAADESAAYCGVTQSAGGFHGVAIFSNAFVNSGWYVRIILFWG